MPRPHYIICCETRLTEPSSGLVSHVNVIEQISLTGPLTSGQQAEPTPADVTGSMIRWTVTAVWRRETDDNPEDTFDVETLMHRPETSEVDVMAQQVCRFQESWLYRLDINILIGMARLQSGILRFESRLRRHASTDPWMSQEFHVQVMSNLGGPNSNGSASR